MPWKVVSKYGGLRRDWPLPGGILGKARETRRWRKGKEGGMGSSEARPDGVEDGSRCFHFCTASPSQSARHGEPRGFPRRLPSSPNAARQDRAQPQSVLRPPTSASSSRTLCGRKMHTIYTCSHVLIVLVSTLNLPECERHAYPSRTQPIVPLRRLRLHATAPSLQGPHDNSPRLNGAWGGHAAPCRRSTRPSPSVAYPSGDPPYGVSS